MVCQTQLGELQERYPDFQDLNTEVITVSKDDLADAAEMRNVVAADYIILSDPEGVAVKAYGVDNLLDDGVATPSTFIIGPDGVIRWAYIGQDASDRPSVDQTLAALIETIADIRYTLFSEQELGVSFMHPKSWTSVPVGEEEEGTWAIFEGDGGVSLMLMAEFNDPGSDLRPTVVRAIERAIPEGAIPSIEDLSYFSLDNGNPSIRTELFVQSGGETLKVIIQIAQRGSATLVLIQTGPVEMSNYQKQAIDTIFDTFAISLPSPHGIDRKTAFTMPLGKPSTLDPHVARETTSHFYVSGIFSGLVKLDEGLSVVPDLAESWQVDESGTVYTFTIKENITFHDGRPITAADFKYSLERATDPELHSDTAFLYLSDIVGVNEKLEGESPEISGVVVVDDRTLRITIDAPKEYFVAKLTYPTSYVVDSASVEGQEEEWWRAQPLNGSGPYMLHSWDEEEAIILKRFDGYHSPVAMQHIISPFVALPGANGRDMYESGYWDGIYLRLSSVNRLRADEALGSHVREFDQLVSYFVGIDSDQAPLDDPMVRRALAMAVDRQKMIDELFGGNLQLANGLLPPGIPGFSEGLQGISFDPAEARMLLAESSYGDDLPEITFLATDQDGEPSSMVQFLLDSWEENLGLTVGVNLVEPEEYVYHLEEQTGHLFTYGWVADYPDPENFLDLLLHSESHDSRYANPAYDELLEQARVTQNREARLQLYRLAEQLLIDDTGIIPLFHVKEYALIQPYVRNFAIGAVGQPEISNVEYEGGP